MAFTAPISQSSANILQHFPSSSLLGNLRFDYPSDRFYKGQFTEIHFVLRFLLPTARMTFLNIHSVANSGSFKKLRKDPALCPSWYIISLLLLLLKVALLSVGFQECQSRIQPQELSLPAFWELTHFTRCPFKGLSRLSPVVKRTKGSGNAACKMFSPRAFNLETFFSQNKNLTTDLHAQVLRKEKQACKK